jgi:hypothetical protein
MNPTANKPTVTIPMTTKKVMRAMNTSKRLQVAQLAILVASVAVTAAACGPEMDPVSLVERARVVGARVEVEGAPDRASPAPGETARVQWLMTAPGAMPALSWAFVVCPGAGTNSGADIVCAGEPAAVFQGQGVPELRFPIPAREQLGDVRRLVVLGRVCTDSTPVLDPGGTVPRCASDPGAMAPADGTTAALSIPIALDQPANRNPSLAAASLTLDGQPWTASETATCAELPMVKAWNRDDKTSVREHAIRIEATGVERERYVATAGDPPAPVEKREWLQISHFTTAGELDRSITAVEAEDPRESPSVEMNWDAPELAKVPAEGQVVRFTFVVRDMRGGVDWLGRSLCVLP